MDYLDFRIQVTGRSYGEYSAEVISSPVGETVRGTPIPDPLQITALRSKLATNPSEASVRALGTHLFESLFTGEVLDMLGRAITLAQDGERELHIQLDIEPNELSALPWEMLFDPVTQQFLALSNRTTLARYVYRYETTRPVPVAESRVRVLALFPSPEEMPPIDIDHERQVMEEALAPLISSALVELIVLEHTTVQEMVETLRTNQVHILYYQGHVGIDPYPGGSYFLLENPDGEPFVKKVEHLSYTLRMTGVPLAVINSCGMAAGPLAYDLVRSGIPGAVATQEPLSDYETMTFLSSFSRALVNGRPLDAAVSEGRRAMVEKSGLGGHWVSPILVINRADTALFALEEQR